MSLKLSLKYVAAACTERGSSRLMGIASGTLLPAARYVSTSAFCAREKAGTVEHVHDEIKNALAGGHMPSQHFAVNAAWFKLALLSYNIASAIKGLCFSPEERTVRFKKYRLLLVHLAGRMSRFQCKLRLRFRASKEAIARVQKVWAVFALPTQATAFT